MKALLALVAGFSMAIPALADEGAANARGSRIALEQWAGCVARSNVGEATRVLKMDFRSPTYDRALRLLAQDSRDCIRFQGTLRSGGLLFAGELAEALIEQPGEPLVNRLARVAASPAAESFSLTDKVAICTVRSAPNEVAALFASERQSENETAALAQASAVMGLCAKAAEANRPLSINPAGLRAMLATAAFRSVASLKDN
jgi:hypothetical protein